IYAVALNGPNTYTGGTTIGSSNANSGGTTILGISSVGAPGSITSGPFGTGTVTMNMTAAASPNPVLQVGGTGAGRTVANAITMTSGFTVTNTSAQSLTLTGPITLGTTSRVMANNLDFGGVLTLGSSTSSSTITASSALVIQTSLIGA